MIKNIFQEKNLFWISLISRAVILIIGVFLAGGSLLNTDSWQKAWVHWDGEHYLDIAENGYDSTWPEYQPEHEMCNQGTGYCQRNYAFFPLYPVTIGLVSKYLGIEPLFAGLGLSILCFSIASVFLYKIAKHFSGNISGNKTAIFSYILLILWPAGYVFSAVMTESLFLMLLCIGIYALIQKKYFLAGIAGFLLAFTRNTGVLFSLVAILFILLNELNIFKILLNKFQQSLFLTGRTKFEKFTNTAGALLSIILPVIGLGIFMAYCNNIVEDPLAFINIQKYWEKPVLGLNPVFAVFFSFVDWTLEGSLINHIYNLVWVLVWGIFFIYSIKKKLFPMWMNFVWLWVLVPLTAGSMLAISRYLAVVLPLYITIGYWLANRSKIVKAGVFMILFLCQLVLLKLYTAGWWITV